MTRLPARGGCPSCAIAAGRAPATVVSETPAFVAFLDPDPIRRGHLQVLPRAHFPSFNALPAALARELLDLAERLAAAQRVVFRVDRVGFLFPAERGAHAAVHLVPLLSAGDIVARRGTAKQQPAVRDEAAPIDLEMERTARLLRARLSAAESMGAMP